MKTVKFNGQEVQFTDSEWGAIEAGSELFVMLGMDKREAIKLAIKAAFSLKQEGTWKP